MTGHNLPDISLELTRVTTASELHEDLVVYFRPLGTPSLHTMGLNNAASGCFDEAVHPGYHQYDDEYENDADVTGAEDKSVAETSKHEAQKPEKVERNEERNLENPRKLRPCKREAIYWIGLSALCLLFLLCLATLMLTVFTNTVQEKVNTGTDPKDFDREAASSAPSPSMHVIVQVGSRREVANAETSNSVSSIARPTASSEKDKTTQTMKSPPTSTEKVTRSKPSTTTMASPPTSSETVPSPSTMLFTSSTTKSTKLTTMTTTRPTIKTTTKPTSKSTTEATTMTTTKQTTKQTTKRISTRAKKPTTKPTSTTTAKPGPHAYPS
ncbi:hypothetical protein MRX96_026703 [Rhipicephalus microplus]